MIPDLPHEIIESILKPGMLELVEEERHDTTLTGQANAFLLSASLVSRTWRNIAQPLLLKHGLVDPTKSNPFIRGLERAGLKDSLKAVRVGLHALAVGSFSRSPENEKANRKGLYLILRKVPGLQSLEIVGEGIRFGVHSLFITGVQGDAFGSLLMDLAGAFLPASLTFVEASRVRAGRPAQRLDRILDSNTTKEVLRLIEISTSLHLEAFGPNSITEALASERAPLAMSNLRAIHLEATSSEARYFYFLSHEHLGLSKTAPLVSLATHLSVFQDPTGRYPPNLTTVKILMDPEDYESELEVTPEDETLNIVAKLSALEELEVPNCCWSDAVEKACEARGVVLTWSVKCEH